MAGLTCSGHYLPLLKVMPSGLSSGPTSRNVGWVRQLMSPGLRERQ